MSRIARVARETWRVARGCDVGRTAAALAFYAVFSLPALLALASSMAASVYGPVVVERRLTAEIQDAFGPDGARALTSAVEHAARLRGASSGAIVLAYVGLLFGATGFLAQLQAALARMWADGEPPRRRGFAETSLRRLLALGLVGAFAALLLASVAWHAVLAAYGDRLLARFAPWAGAAVLATADAGASFLLSGALLATMYRVMPDARVAWRDVLPGAALGAAAFVAGKSAVGSYLGHARPGEAYGAAGPLALLLVLLQFACLVVLVGAATSRAVAGLRARRRRGTDASASPRC